jgi:hypothetical protein
MALESLACCMSYGKWRRLRPRRVCPAPAAHCGAPTVSVDDSSHLIHFALDVLAVGFLMKVGEEFLRTYPPEIACTAAYVGSAGVVFLGWMLLRHRVLPGAVPEVARRVLLPAEGPGRRESRRDRDATGRRRGALEGWRPRAPTRAGRGLGRRARHRAQPGTHFIT